MPSCAVPTCAGRETRQQIPFPQHSKLKIRWIRAIVAGTGLDLPARHLGTICSWHFADQSAGTVDYWEPVRFLHSNGTIVTVSSCRFCQQFDDHTEMVATDRLLENANLALVIQKIFKMELTEGDLVVDICKRCNSRFNSLAKWIDECRAKEDEYRAFELAAESSAFSIECHSGSSNTEKDELENVEPTEPDSDPLMLPSEEIFREEVIEEENLIMPEPIVVKVEEGEQEPMQTYDYPPNIPGERGRPQQKQRTKPPTKKLKFRDILSRKCYICNTLLATHEDMAAHLATDHTDRSTFHCADCDQSFNVVTSYNRHLGFHDQEHRPLKCHFCPMGFKDLDCLQRHENRQHETQHQIKLKVKSQAKNFQCASCDKAFRTNYDLVDHDRYVHQKLPGATCKLCGRHFRNRASLRKHHLVHSEDKPYGCELCEAAFKSKWHLIKHRAKFHSGPEGAREPAEDEI